MKRAVLAIIFAMLIAATVFVIRAKPAGASTFCVPPMSHWQFKQRRIA